MSTPAYLPYFVHGDVVSGFGRGGKELGIPTANFSSKVVDQLPSTFECGVYYGWAAVDGYSDVCGMVMSLGWNDFYGSHVKTMETHILGKFDKDFYGRNLRVIILGFIRPMCNFDSLDALISAIHNDIHFAENQLAQPDKQSFKRSPYFKISLNTPSSFYADQNSDSDTLSDGNVVLVS